MPVTDFPNCQRLYCSECAEAHAGMTSEGILVRKISLSAPRGHSNRAPVATSALQAVVKPLQNLCQDGFVARLLD